MNRTKWPQMILGGVSAVLLAGAGLMAAATVPDVIEMKHEAYAAHEKPIVEFKHKSHTSEFQEKYPDFFKNGCGTCHHDDEGQPLTELEAGDEVNACIECHSEPGEITREVRKQMQEKDLSYEEKKAMEREYHAEALHDLCRGCHRNVKKENRDTVAPTTCMKCHTKDDS